jgi:hypothetical protein
MQNMIDHLATEAFEVTVLGRLPFTPCSIARTPFPSLCIYSPGKRCHMAFRACTFHSMGLTTCVDQSLVNEMGPHQRRPTLRE